MCCAVFLCFFHITFFLRAAAAAAVVVYLFRIYRVQCVRVYVYACLLLLGKFLHAYTLAVPLSNVLTINVLKLHIRYIGQCRNNGKYTNVHREMCIRIRNYRWFTVKVIRSASARRLCV